MGQQQSHHKQPSSAKSRRESFLKQESATSIACSEAASDFSVKLDAVVDSQGNYEFYLKKRREGHFNRRGLHWQEDPTGETWLHNGRNWPRDYATLRGKVVTVKGKKWLLATEVKQPGSGSWTKAPKGAAIPFFFRNTYCLVPNKQYSGRQRQSIKSTTLAQKQKLATFAEDLEGARP